ncbi:HNH endonuclease [Paenibacillus silviterrae]|uniref:HNH endonuclease n=1 Tax=Paenibacillus silviterrae TaxID=3242194 RepID=UPI0025430A2A|nr:HNH endonuclease signature motif containing protein [Paenibacillus chinjuensis]
MPKKPLRPCSRQGCKELTRERHCANCAGEYDKQRGSSYQRGYDSRWRKERLTFLLANPLCRHCLERQHLSEATVVDHIIPHRGDQRLFWDQSNWQALCDSCHSTKTAKEDGGFGNQQNPNRLGK